MRRAILLAGLLAAASPLMAQQVLNLRDADIRAFIQDASRVTGRTFIIDPQVQGKVSVVSDRPLSRTEYLEVFLSTLRANGYVAVPAAGGAFRVQPANGAAAAAGRVGTGRASANSFATEVFRLQTIDAQSAVDTIRPLVGPGGSVTASRTGNAVVVADYADNLRRIRDVLSRIDRDSAATRVVPLRNAGAREIAGSLQQLVGTSGQGGPAASVVAIDSSNAIALRGDSSTVARLARIAEELDRRAENGAEIRVIFLRHAEAEKLVPVLQQLVGQAVTATPAAVGGSGAGPAGPGQASGAGASQPVSTPSVSVSTGGSPQRGTPVIARYEGANAVIIAAPSDVQRTLGEVVRQLDTRREQVLVEAIIVEIGDVAAKALGVQYLLGGLPGSGVPFAATNYSNAAPNLLTIAGAIGARELATTTTVVNGTTVTTTTNNQLSDNLAQQAVNSILGAGGSFAGFAGKLGSNAIFGAIINAVKSDNKSNLLSTPSIMTLDNQEAKILVGQEIPITTGQALSNNFDNAFRTVQRENVGISLEVKPQINAGGAINLAIKQEVSSIAGPVGGEFNDLILNKRQIETVVTVDDGEIVALGGLLDDNERRTIEKIPFLGDIPGLGVLFRSKARSRSKTNLMVFIRPTILRTSADSREVAERRYGYARAQQLQQRPDVEPSLDEMVRDYMGAAPPVPAVPLPGSTPPAVAPAPVVAGPQVVTPGVVPVPALPDAGTIQVPVLPSTPPAQAVPQQQIIVPRVSTSSERVTLPSATPAPARRR
ncbi:type II secretion system secretin GspD [Sphingomonas jatrophae]|uniref:General secretion pathway protein D n=1 Tax=Sphingomonas jatrophae TaxID=1166337 RepID=A0A1I6JCV2_9SPHN|nr:type II secretion system secretin GspD [Sphingomonas jatrophae]SFR76843.1 general secretion pathway protein D [Sphingomonas jatrophae]